MIYVIIKYWNCGDSWRLVKYTHSKKKAKKFCEKAMPDRNDDGKPCRLIFLTMTLTTEYYFRYYTVEELGDK